MAGPGRGGWAMSTVLMLHVWNAKTIRLALVLNEAALMAIGILMGVVMNAYMPRRTRVIREDQRITEERIRIILRNMGRYLREEDTMNTFPSQIQTDIRGLSAHLDEARCRAVSLGRQSLSSRYALLSAICGDAPTAVSGVVQVGRQLDPSGPGTISFPLAWQPKSVSL